MSYDVDSIRAQFPILKREVHGKPLVYLDTAASSQRPECCVRATDEFYRQHNANIHRGVHTLAEEATERFEAVRAQLAKHINARSAREIVFTRGTTEAINLVANSFARSRLKPGDEILISHMEHHSNIVPWQLLCEQTGAKLKVIPINDVGELQVDALESLITKRTRLLGLVHISNALGTVNPVKKVIEIAHANNVPVLLDGAQALPHSAVDVQDLDVDFYACSAHKMYGPTGIGALYGKLALLEEMPPWQGGGEMISEVRFDGTTFNAVPAKFEAGTPNIAGVVGWGASLTFLNEIGLDNIARYEQTLLEYGTRRLAEVPGLKMVGQAREKAGVMSFVIDGAHAGDLGVLLDQHGVAIRTGHHCAMPAMQRFGLDATARASLGLYTTRQELDRFVDALLAVTRMLAA